MIAEPTDNSASTKEVKTRSDEGFTLMEVIIAISILTTGLLAVASMQISAIRGNALASHETTATTLGADRAEKLMALPYDHADLSAGNHTDPSPPKSYSIWWNITEDSPLNNTKTVTVTVTWAEHGMQKNISLQRIVPRII